MNNVARCVAALLLASLPLYAQAQTPAAAFDDAARAAVVEKAADALRNRYIFPDVGEKAAAKIEAQLAAGAYKDLEQPRLRREADGRSLRGREGQAHARLGARPRPLRLQAALRPPRRRAAKAASSAPIGLPAISATSK